MSEFWRRKMRTCFAKFDSNNDGVISKEEFIGLAVQYANFEAADKQKAEHLKALFENEWELIVQRTDPSDATRITIDACIDGAAKQRYDPELAERYRNHMHALFDLMDVNCDGCIQADEYERMLIQLKVPDASSFAKESFKAMDVNGDGNISFDEFINAYHDFMFSEDENSPYSVFYGPLVD